MTVNYSEDAMKDLMARDVYIKFMVKNLQKKGHNLSDALLYAFNSSVLEDSAMSHAYMTYFDEDSHE
jgi:hypothetical protein